jgi:hypothetical protein
MVSSNTRSQYDHLRVHNGAISWPAGSLLARSKEAKQYDHGPQSAPREIKLVLKSYRIDPLLYTPNPVVENLNFPHIIPKMHFKSGVHMI